MFGQIRQFAQNIAIASIIALPLAITFRDLLYSTYSVRGASMEPTLKEGDVVLVRKGNFKSWIFHKLYWSHNWDGESITMHAKDCKRDHENTDNHEHRQELNDELGHGANYLYPPRILPGAIVVFQSPTNFPVQYNIKRLVAQQGQRLRQRKQPRWVQVLDSHQVWVEGDNSEESYDSSHFGALNQQLIVGQAEYIIWPPSRIGKLHQVAPPLGRAW